MSLNIFFNELPRSVNTFFIICLTGSQAFFNGFKIFSLPHSLRSVNISVICFCAGITIPLYKAPTIPPVSFPCHSASSPNKNFLNVFVELKSPNPAPIAALPSKPNGPNNAPPTAPTAILGTALSTIDLNLS